MSSNNPATMGGFWFFQSTWDPPARGYAGMNYTGAGVGNRNGVYIQLAGTVIAVSGMLFAFYVKPIIRRNRQNRASGNSAESSASPPESVEETLAVINDNRGGANLSRVGRRSPVTHIARAATWAIHRSIGSPVARWRWRIRLMSCFDRLF